MYKYEKAKTGKFKKILRTILLIIITSALSIFLYKMYEGIEIDTYGAQVSKSNEVKIEKTSNTVDKVKEQSKQIADIVEEVTSCVVGISKIKNAGGTIFLENGTTSLGLGTGVIIAEDRIYIIK